MIPFADDVVWPWLVCLANWSLRWAVLICLVAVWLTLRPPRRTEIRSLLCWSVLAAGLLLPAVPRWGAGLGPAMVGDSHVPDGDVAAVGAVERLTPSEPSPLSEEPHGRWSRELPPDAGRDFDENWAAESPAAPVVAVAREAPAAGPPSLGWGGIAVLGLGAGWALGVAACLVRLLGGMLWLARFRRTLLPLEGPAVAVFQSCCRAVSLGRRVRIASHVLVSSPVTFGVLRPVIVVPSDWADLPAGTQRAALLHELSHVVLYDGCKRLVLELVRAVFFFHPLVHWLIGRIHLEGELLCDEAILLAGQDGSEQARVLLDFAVRPNRLATGRFLARPSVAVPFGHVGTVQRRIEHLLKLTSATYRPPLALPWRIVLGAALLVVACCVGGIRLRAEATAENPGAGETSAATLATRPDSAPEPAGFLLIPQSLCYEPLEIRRVAFSPNGKLLAAAHGCWSTPGGVRVWDRESGKLLAEFPEPRGVISVAFSPDSQRLAYARCGGAGNGTEACVVNVTTKKAVKFATADAARVVFSPDGKLLATATERPARVSLRDPSTGNELRALDGELFRFQDVCFSPDGSLIAAGGGAFEGQRDGRVSLWDVATGQQRRVMNGHQAPVLRVTFSPDGKTLGSASLDGTVRLWDSASGTLKATLEAGAELESVAFSPDGKHAVTAGYDTTVRLWDVATGDQRAQLREQSATVFTAEFSPDGATLATAGAEGVVRLWDVARREQTRVLELDDGQRDPPQPIVSVACSPDGRTIASVHEDKTVRLRDNSGNVLRTLRGHEAEISCVAYAPDGKLLATASCDHTVKLWAADNGTEQGTLTGHADWVLSVAFSPDGKALASCSRDKTIRVWDLQTRKQSMLLEGHTLMVRCLAFSLDGKLLASGSLDGTVKVWDLGSQRPLATLAGRYGGALAFLPQGRVLASACEDGTILLWDADNGTERKMLTKHDGGVWCLASSPGGRTLASGGSDGTIKLWDPESARERRTLSGHTGIVTSLAFLPHAQGLVSGSADRTLRLWKSEPLVPPLATIAGHRGSAYFALFSPDGRQIVTGGDDRLVNIWDVQTGTLVRFLAGHARAVRCGAFSPDGALLATGDIEQGKVVLWDARSGAKLRVLEGHTGEIVGLAFSPAGNQLASASSDKTARIWEVATGQTARVLNHANAVSCLAYSPDGRLLATATINLVDWTKPGPVRLWDAQTGSETASLTGHTHNVTMVRFSPDGKLLATGGGDSRVHLWDVQTLTLQGSFWTYWGVPAMEFLRDGKSLAVGTNSGGVSTWSLTTLREDRKYEGHEGFTQGGVYGLGVSPDGTVIATVGRTGLVKLWPAAGEQATPDSTAAALRHLGERAAGPVQFGLKAMPAPDELAFSVMAQEAGAWFVAFAPDGATLAVGGSDRTARLLDAGTGKLRAVLRGHEDRIACGAFSPDGRTLATAGFDTTVRLWDASTGTERLVLRGHSGPIRAVLFSRDGQTLISGGGKDGLVKLWDAGTGNETMTLKGAGVMSMALSPDGKRLVTGNWDKTIRVWNVAAGQSVLVLGSQPEPVASVAFSPDGKLLVSTSATHDSSANVKVWDTGPWRERTTLVGHTHHVLCAQFSPDGQTLATASADGTVRLWNALTGKELKVLRQHTGAVLSLAFSPAGRRLASTGLDGTVKVWNLESSDPAPTVK